MISGLMKTRGSRLGLAVLVGLGEIHGDQPQRLRDLDRRKPDAGRVVHGLEHVVGKLADLRRDLLDRLGDQPQLLVGQDDDFSDGHGGRFKLRDGKRSMRPGTR